jgi:hypothetical protein
MAIAVIASRRRVAQEKERHDKEKLEAKHLVEVIHKYNGGEGDQMTPEQMKKYLQDLGTQTYNEMRAFSDLQPALKELYGMPPGEFPAVSDNEVLLMLRMADKSGEGTIRKEEVAGLISAWTTYLWNKPVYESEIKKFDFDGDKKLSSAEVKKYLENLTQSKSEDVKDDDVDFVMKKADNLAVDNKIGVEEYVFATAAWEGVLQNRREEAIKRKTQAKGSRSCSVL